MLPSARAARWSEPGTNSKVVLDADWGVGLPDSPAPRIWEGPLKWSLNAARLRRRASLVGNTNQDMSSEDVPVADMVAIQTDARAFSCAIPTPRFPAAVLLFVCARTLCSATCRLSASLHPIDRARFLAACRRVSMQQTFAVPVAEAGRSP